MRRSPEWANLTAIDAVPQHWKWCVSLRILTCSTGTTSAWRVCPLKCDGMNSEFSLAAALTLLAAPLPAAGSTAGAPNGAGNNEPHTHSTTSCSRVRMRHILVPLDGSKLAEQALPFAAAVSKANLPQITLLRVLEFGRGVTPDALEWEIMRREGMAYLAGVQEKLRAGG